MSKEIEYGNKLARFYKSCCIKKLKIKVPILFLVFIANILTSCEKETEYMYPEHNYLSESYANVTIEGTVDNKQILKSYHFNSSVEGITSYKVEEFMSKEINEIHIDCLLNTSDMQNNISLNIVMNLERQVKTIVTNLDVNYFNSNNEIVNISAGRIAYADNIDMKDFYWPAGNCSFFDLSHNMEEQIISYKFSDVTTENMKYKITGDVHLKYIKTNY